jgi:methionine--tRNA ligase beta chain
MISFDDFQKLDIRIGKIKSAERIPDTDKLLKLVFQLGDEERQIIAGIADVAEDPEELVGKEMPVLINLEPKMLRGHESQGMILAASSDEGPVLLHPEKEVPSGSKVK